MKFTKYNITPNFALNRMDDIDAPELYIFTEDKEALILSKTIYFRVLKNLRKNIFIQMKQIC